MLLFKAVLAGLAALSSAVSATELIPNLGERIAHELETRQTNILAVTGVRTNAGVHPRLELGDLMRNWDQANLYLLGLQRMQNMPQNHPLSYFQIAGQSPSVGPFLTCRELTFPSSHPRTPLRGLERRGTPRRQ